MNTADTKTLKQCARLRMTLRGVVQGVGFRPFVHRLAKELSLAGEINNSAQGVSIEVEGPREVLERFSRRLNLEKPSCSCIQSCETAWLEVVGFRDFTIVKSEAAGDKVACVSPDIAMCPDCLREMLDPTNRRHRYPFINCTNCGPRFTIIESIPYDRPNTSMRKFAMCPECLAEYDNPIDRRFHAQPNACPACGPRLEFWNRAGEVLFGGNEALLAAAHAIRCGRIVAVKGIGGFHLMADARSEDAVKRLRDRKQREEKPFALMFPSLESVKGVCEVSLLEERLLQSPEAPIVLLRRRSTIHSQLSTSLAPNNPNLGVMLPSNPLHHLLMLELGFPVVATSGNLSDEPICTDEVEALNRLHDIADVFLVHDRPIMRHMDDSILRVVAGRELMLRRARGFAPLPIEISAAADAKGLASKMRTELEPPHVGCYKAVLAVGAHLKNSVALALGEQVFTSQHIGDLETEQANHTFRRAAEDLPRLYDVSPEIVVADLHPDYLSTKFALERVPDARLIQVQHHVAHVLSCIAENDVELPALGVAWDGTGCGPDGSVWGGEFFLVKKDRVVERVAYLRPFRLPGGDAAVKEPRRAALGLLYELLGDAALAETNLPTLYAFTESEIHLMRKVLKRGLNAPQTSSVGRLFDAVASLVGLRQQMRFEGQAAMELESAMEASVTDAAYTLLSEHGRDGWHKSPIILDWQPMIEALLADIRHGVDGADISAKFHNALVRTISAVAIRLGQKRVVLSGGCFQNRYLLEHAVARLQVKGFKPFWHQRVPPNDGGIALGQVYAARNGIELKGK